MIELFLKKCNVIKLCLKCNVVVCCLVSKACLNPWEFMDCSLPGSSSMDFPDKNTGVSYHFLFQGIFLTQGSNPSLLHWQADSLPSEPPLWPWKWKSLSRVWLCDTMDYTVHRILQARILEWVAFSFSRGSSQPRDGTGVSCIAGGFFTDWAIRKAPPL